MIPYTVAYQAPLSMEFPGKNIEVGCYSLLQGIFRTQGSNLGVPHCNSRFFTIWATREALGNPLQYSCLENTMDRGAWQARVHKVIKSNTHWSDLACMHVRWRKSWGKSGVGWETWWVQSCDGGKVSRVPEILSWRRHSPLGSCEHWCPILGVVISLHFGLMMA